MMQHCELAEQRVSLQSHWTTRRLLVGEREGNHRDVASRDNSTILDVGVRTDLQLHVGLLGYALMGVTG